MYQRFDGILLPEHVKEPTKSEFWLKGKFKSTVEYVWKDPLTCGGEKLSSCNYATRNLSELNHKQLRKNALLMHLEEMYNALHRKESTSIFISYIESVCAAFETLNKYHLSYTAQFMYNSIKEICWEFIDTKQVCIYIYACLL